ncbi:MAG: single-stranded DNA-binding protein [Lentimicrobium sp.]|jgi:single-strand DNA-binding protein|nr:single-stranded DNA-binding protein [Lentimicrobium sp.]MDD2528454.1 single-stranded DNA-binding protein [Lentimicrobiaceae bacterium]MDD4598423.1 single-stranded DNA-binding protein [Lentimicrobiaceae bacterium]MDY0026947.1 single-stranded DNA-binding protein [Lentimicrobium sp.]HAH59617.1 single-stranded DNA-binding protein [Bacteroidales bacterium]
MARGVNKVILIGNLGKDPEVVNFDNGVKKASFSLATNDSYKNREGQEVDRTEWHNIVMWRGLAEVAEKYLRKGSQVYIEGSLRTRSYEKDGQKRYITDIECTEMTMLGGRPSDQTEQSGGQSNQEQYEPPAPTLPEKEDDLPF